MKRAPVLLLLAALVAAAQGADMQETSSAPGKPAGNVRLDLLNKPRVLRANAGDPFGARSWVVVPPPPPPAPVVVEAPRAPPLPFRYLGQVDDGRGNRNFFLVRGTATLTIAVGESIDNVYRLESADNGILNFTYLPLRVRQSLQIGVGP